MHFREWIDTGKKWCKWKNDIKIQYLYDNWNDTFPKNWLWFIESETCYEKYHEKQNKKDLDSSFRNVKLFHGCDPGLLKSLVLKLQPMLFLPNDYICRKGDVGKGGVLKKTASW